MRQSGNRFAVVIIILITVISSQAHTLTKMQPRGTESFLWLKERLNLSRETYMKVVKQVRNYKEKGYEREITQIRDSIAHELAHDTTDMEQVFQWQNEITRRTSEQVEQFTDHLIQMRTVFTEAEYERYIALINRIYWGDGCGDEGDVHLHTVPPKREYEVDAITHAHPVGDGTVKKHDHKNGEVHPLGVGRHIH